MKIIFAIFVLAFLVVGCTTQHIPDEQNQPQEDSEEFDINLDELDELDDLENFDAELDELDNLDLE